MINREIKKVNILSYGPILDEWGQKRTGQANVRQVEMYISIYNQSNVADPRYVDVEMIGLTKSKDITDKDEIECEGIKYIIKYVIPSRRYTQVLMSKKAQ